MGDHNWRRLLDSHDQLARQTVERHRSNLIKNTADGILATVDGPGRAVRCAPAFSAAAEQIGLPLRSGLHTGEIEVRGRDIGGIAVHAAARVMANSEPEEVVVIDVNVVLAPLGGQSLCERDRRTRCRLPLKARLSVMISSRDAKKKKVTQRHYIEPRLV